MFIIYLLIALLAGIAVATQSAINSQLAKAIKTSGSDLQNFCKFIPLEA